MLEEILASTPPYPAHLHRHILQMYLIKHRRPPSSMAEQRRAVYEYLSRTQHDKSGAAQVLANPELADWLQEEDEQVRGWGPVPRLAALVYQFGRDLRKRYDLGVERDYKEFACFVALTLQGALRWPENFVARSLKDVLGEDAPGIPQCSRVRATRAIQFIRRNSATVRSLDLAKVADFSKMLLRVMSDIDEGILPRHALSPAQYAYLSQPVKLRQPRIRLTGLLHHLIIERGLVREEDLARPDVLEAVRREVPALLARLRLPLAIREAHGGSPAAVTPIEPPSGIVPIVTVVGPVSHGSGLGAASRASLEAIKAAGIDVEVLNLEADWGRTDEDEGSLFCTRVRGDINLIHFNPDVIIENLTRFGVEQFEGRYNIGFFFWETSQASLAHRLGMHLVDEVWVSSEYCREVFQKVTDKPVVVVRTPVPRIDDVSWATRRYFGIAEGKFTFVYTFDGASRFTRKHPLGAVDAFQRAFPADDSVQLVLKTQNTQWLTAPDERIYAGLRAHARRDRRIVVIDESFSSNEVHGLISVCDCYLALHRSEGFGFGMAEAMKLRVPVIATGDSGNADFTTEETSWPVRFRRVPVTSREFVYAEDGQEWADPDLEHAAARMLEVRTDPKRAVKVQRAYEFIHAHYDRDVVGETYRQRIEAIRAGLLAGADVAKVAA